MVENNIGLVHSCCRRFVGKSIEYDDLFQAGCVGLVKASRDFDESRGFMFSTYAVPVILGEIKRLFRDGGLIKVSRSLKELSLKVSREKEKFEKTEGRQAGIGELANILSVTSEEITEALSVSTPTVSLTYEDGDEIREIVLVGDDPAEDMTDRLMIAQAMEGLDKNDKEIIICRYFRGLSQQNIAKKLNMTQVQVSRREKKILEQMRKTLS